MNIKENSNTSVRVIPPNNTLYYNYSILYYLSKEMYNFYEWALEAYIKEYGERSSRKAKPAIECLCSHIIRAYSRGYYYITISRSRGFYFDRLVNGKPLTHNVGYKGTINLLNVLEKYGYIEYHRGHFIKETGEIKRGVIEITSRLAARIHSEVDLDKINPVAEENVLIIRDAEAEPIKFTLTEDLTKQKEVLDNYNKMMLNHSVVYEGVSVKCDLKRIFCNSSVREGGRLYTSGKNYQQLSAPERKKILIDGDNTAEVDIVSCHYTMLACDSGITLGEGEDPYYRFDINQFGELDEVSLFEAGEEIKTDYNPVRNIAKDCFMFCVNSRDKSQAKRAMQQAIVKDRNKDFSKRRYNGIINVDVEYLLNHADGVFEEVNEHFFTGIGTSLQKAEGDIFLQVMERCVDEDIPVLIIHDSARTREQDVMKVGRFIKEAWFKLFKDTSNLKLEYEE